MNAMSPEPFGHTIRRMREASGLTQEELAELAGLSARGISDIERGVRATPRLETVRFLADGLGLDDDQRKELFAIRNGSSESTTRWFRHATSEVPIPASSFVGRKREVESIAATVVKSDVHLLTLTGPGGVGKTRLAIEAAHRLEGAFTHGATFIDLSPIGDPEVVLVSIAARLGLREQPGTDLKSVLQVALQDREQLLILDNLEQVVAAASDISWLLTTSPGLTILATSRVVLRISGEHVLEVEPMDVSDGKELQPTDAVSLFVERATSASSSFLQDDDNAREIYQLVESLQGMPLAIELAAARIRMWPVAELLGRLDSQLTLLAGGAVDTPDRHRSMRDTIAWSYALLTPRDQAVFRVMSIFPVGCTLDTANAVLAEHRNIDQVEVLEAICTLVDSSLVRPREGIDHRIRYRMLVPVREFGLEQLEVCDESTSVRWSAHHSWVEPLAVRSELVTLEPDSLSQLRYLDAEHPNLDEHIDWLIHQNEVLAALNLYGLLSTSRWIHGPNMKSRQNMEKLLALPKAQAHTPERLRGLLGLMSDYESADDLRKSKLHLDAAETIARELNNHNGLLRVLLAQANNLTFSGDFVAAERYFDELNAIAMQEALP